MKEEGTACGSLITEEGGRSLWGGGVNYRLVRLRKESGGRRDTLALWLIRDSGKEGEEHTRSAFVNNNIEEGRRGGEREREEDTRAEHSLKRRLVLVTEPVRKIREQVTRPMRMSRG
jgi:hypothetical protein